MHRMEAGVAKFAALVVGEYAGLLTEHIDEQRLRTELMLDMARAVSASLELPDVLRRAARGIASAAGGRHSSICLLDEEVLPARCGPAPRGLFPRAVAVLGTGRATGGQCEREHLRPPGP